MNKYTDCPHCQNIVYNEERGHIESFDQFFISRLVTSLLDRRDDIHIAIDVSKADDPWELMCYHVTWRRNLPNHEEEIDE